MQRYGRLRQAAECKTSPRSDRSRAASAMIMAWTHPRYTSFAYAPPGAVPAATMRG
jgi:hypothetical protein